MYTTLKEVHKNVSLNNSNIVMTISVTVFVLQALWTRRDVDADPIVSEGNHDVSGSGWSDQQASED